jgi:hypothetical protein
MACAAANIEPLIATGRQPHHPSWRERRDRRRKTRRVFGIIKSVMGFRQFLLRGLDCVRGEWSLVTMAWNIKRMHALSLG